MFKLVSNTGHWSELYVSEYASDALQRYMPAGGDFRGRDDGVLVTALAELERSEEERSRYILLLTEAGDAASVLPLDMHLTTRTGSWARMSPSVPGARRPSSDRTRARS